jgi:exodeoxyribonuclease-3
MKIASWNVNSLRVRLPHVLQWLESVVPDVVGIQETKLEDGQFPREALEEAGYRVVFNGQKTYNGVALLAREEPREVVTGLALMEDVQRRVLGATVGKLRIYNLYVPNGQAVGSEKYEYKLEWLAALRKQLEDELRKHPEMVVMGDFNIAPDDRDVHDPEAWAGQVHCSEPERQALTDILALGFRDTFRLFDQPESVYSWWDYRAAAFRRNRGLRIDLLLVSDTLAERVQASTVDKEPRRWERPSDHAPVVLELDD